MSRKIRIKMMADYFCFPLWMIDDRFESDNIGPMEVPLTEETRRRLQEWADLFDRGLDMNDPAASQWAPEDQRKFDVEGRKLWRVVRHELAVTYEVVYLENGRLLTDPDAQ